MTEGSNITTEDVEYSGVTHVGCWRWFVSRGFSQTGPTDDCGFHHLTGNWGPIIAHGYAHTSWTSRDIAQLINTTGWRDVSPSTVLTEMALIQAVACVIEERCQGATDETVPGFERSDLLAAVDDHMGGNTYRLLDKLSSASVVRGMSAELKHLRRVVASAREALAQDVETVTP